MKSVTTFTAALLLTVGVTYSQQYRISTVVSGVLPLGPMPALEVSVGHVSGVATDGSGNVYFSSARNCVFKLDPGGVLLRVAGTCQGGYSGDGGPATSAGFNWPRGLAVDSAGILYIADSLNCRIRRVARDGVITTIAGNGSCQTSSGDGGPSARATLNYPTAVAVDRSGAVFVAEYDRIRKLLPDNTIATIATGLSNPGGVAVDSDGNLYFANESQVFKVATNGKQTTIAGKPNAFVDSGDGGPALNASFGIIIGLAIDSVGDVLVADGTIRSITPDGVVHTVASTPCCDAANRYMAWAGNAGALAVDPSGNAYLAILLGDVLRRITPQGDVSTVAGTDHPTYVGDGGPAIGGQLSTPQAVAVDAAGNLYIADYGNSRVRKVSSAGVITTVAGTGVSGFSGDGGPAIAARLAGPVGLAIDSAGNLFISEYLNNRVRKVTPEGTINTIAGSDLCCDYGDGGPAIRAVVPMPHGIAVDSAGNLYVAEWPDSRIRKVTTEGLISTLAGNGTSGFAGDGGPAIEAQLSLPWGLAADPNGSIYVADNQNLRIRKIAPDGTITTVAGGSASPSFNLRNVTGIAVDSAGNLFTSGGLRLSSSGGLSSITARAAGGQQVLIDGIGIAVDSTSNLFLVSGDQVLKLESIASPVPIGAVANGASSLLGAVAPGEIVVLYIPGFGPADLTSFDPNTTSVATVLAGTRVLFNGIPAPIVYTSATQICAIVPYSVGNTTVGIGLTAAAIGTPQAAVQVEYQGRTSDTFVLLLTTSSPGIFTVDSSGRGQAVAYNEDGSLNSSANPAHPRSVVTFYATGEGQTNPQGIDGKLGNVPLPQPVLPVNVMVGGITASPRYAGGVLGQVAGLMQVQAIVPDGIPTDKATPIIITVGNVPSQAGVTIAVAGN